MTQSTNEYFAELKEWSERKLSLVKNYLEGATKILGSIDRVYYVDGFAGRGSYGKPGEPQVPGSPLRAAQIADEYSRGGKPYSLRCINVEVDQEIFDGLETVTAPYCDLVLNIHGVFALSVDRILKEVGTKPVICFLDPFGVDGIDWGAVQKLIRRKSPTDFWIRFDVGAVRRRDGYFDKTIAGSDKQFDILSRVYGIEDRDGLHEKLLAPTPGTRKEQAVELYLQRLRSELKASRGEGYAEAYRIGSLDEETKYYLVFASANKKGLILASNIVYGIEENYQRELERYRETAQMTMFPALDPTKEEIFKDKVDNLVQAIRVGCRGKGVTRQDIHAQMLETRFGIIKGPHVTAALKQLKQDGSIVSSKGNVSEDRAHFVFAP